MSESLLKLSSKIQPEHVDLIEGYLYEEAPSPWALEVNHVNGLGVLSGFFSNKEELVKHQTHITSSLGQSVQFHFSTESIYEQDWKEAYKKHFQPWSYKGVNLIPLWLKESHPVAATDISIYLDPGMAFGTGNHESTRMCLEFLIECKGDLCMDGSFIDLGCGSGILSLVAKSIGFQNVLGLDNDNDAVRISHENALLNDLKGSITFTTQDLNNLDDSIGKFNFVMANIQADVLISYADLIMSLTDENSVVVLSGILTQEIAQVLEKFRSLNKSSEFNYTTKEMGEWSAVKIYK